MNINGFTFYEDAGDHRSPDEGYAIDTARVNRSLWFRNGDQSTRFAAAKALLGYSKTVTAKESVKQPDDSIAVVTRRWISRQPPHGYPAILDPDVNPAGDPYLFVVAIEKGDPIGRPSFDGVSSNWQMYRFQVAYRALPHNIKTDDQVLSANPAGPLGSGGGSPARPDEGDALRRGWGYSRWIDKVIEPSSRACVIRNGTMQYATPNKNAEGNLVREPVPGGFPVGEARFTARYIHRQVPIDAIPFVAIQQSMAAINNDTFDSWPAQTMRLDSARLHARQGWGGGRLFDIEYIFSIAMNHMFAPYTADSNGIDQVAIPLGHNSLLAVRSGRLEYWLVQDTAGLNYPHRFVPMDALFRPDQG